MRAAFWKCRHFSAYRHHWATSPRCIGEVTITDTSLCLWGRNHWHLVVSVRSQSLTPRCVGEVTITDTSLYRWGHSHWHLLVSVVMTPRCIGGVTITDTSLYRWSWHLVVSVRSQSLTRRCIGGHDTSLYRWGHNHWHVVVSVVMTPRCIGEVTITDTSLYRWSWHLVVSVRSQSLKVIREIKILPVAWLNVCKSRFSFQLGVFEHLNVKRFERRLIKTVFDLFPPRYCRGPEIPGGVRRGRLYLTLHCDHHYDSCIKMIIDKISFNVTLTTELRSCVKVEVDVLGSRP